MKFLFDLDGPILDVSERYYSIYSVLLKRYVSTILPKDEYWEMKRNRIPEHIIVKQSYNDIPINEYQRLRIEFIESREFLNYDSIWKDIQHTLLSFLEMNDVILITMRSNSENLYWQLSKLNILHRFKDIIPVFTNVETTPNYKDQRWKYKFNKIIASRFWKSANKSEYTFVGDTETDILTAKKLSIKSVAVSFGIRSHELLEILDPDILITNQQMFNSYLNEFI
jgi:phosphoglycolate phosphatase-like HAD superfamily hydrolase